MFDQTHTHTTGNNCQSYTKVSWSAVILEISIFIRLRMMNGQALPIHFIQKNYNFQIDGTLRYLWSQTPKSGPLYNFGLLFPVVFLYPTKLYMSCDKGPQLYSWIKGFASQYHPFLMSCISLPNGMWLKTSHYCSLKTFSYFKLNFKPVCKTNIYVQVCQPFQAQRSWPEFSQHVTKKIYEWCRENL